MKPILKDSTQDKRYIVIDAFTAEVLNCINQKLKESKKDQDLVTDLYIETNEKIINQFHSSQLDVEKIFYSWNRHIKRKKDI